MKWAFQELNDSLGDFNFKLTRSNRYEIKYFDLDGTEISEQEFKKLNDEEEGLPFDEDVRGNRTPGRREEENH